MREVALRAGVSAKTVSRVINGDRYVSDDVRRRVQAAVVDLAYVPNSLARTFRSGRDAAIGVAVPDVSDPFFAAVTHAIEQTARARGTVVFVTSLGIDGEREQSGVETLLGRQLAGLIATPVAADQSYLQSWRTRVGLVFIDRPPRRLPGVDSITHDDHGGAQAATRHLIEHGHRRIAFVGDTPTLATTTRRMAGYRSALTDAGLPTDPRLIQLGVATEAGAGAATAIGDLLRQAHGPTAIFSSNAKCSIALIPVLQDLGRTDVAVVGFGDFPLAAALRPAMTVIDQDPDELGRFAAARLFRRLEQPELRLRRNTTLPVALVLRSSCGPNCPGLRVADGVRTARPPASPSEENNFPGTAAAGLLPAPLRMPSNHPS